MTRTDRINLALELARKGDFSTARNILLLANADDKTWAKFSKMWRAAR